MQRKFEQPTDRRTQLKIKLKSLACEARIIRAEEHKTRNEFTRQELHEHRVKDLRSEARHSYLAYGFIRGRTWEQMEGNSFLTDDTIRRRAGYALIPDWKYINKLLEKFGPKGLRVNEHGQIVKEEPALV